MTHQRCPNYKSYNLNHRVWHEKINDVSSQRYSRCLRPEVIFFEANRHHNIFSSLPFRFVQDFCLYNGGGILGSWAA